MEKSKKAKELIEKFGDKANEVVQEIISYVAKEGTDFPVEVEIVLLQELQDEIASLQNLFTYCFIYKDSKGEMGYTFVKVKEQNSELAIATFEKIHPDLVWRDILFIP